MVKQLSTLFAQDMDDILGNDGGNEQSKTSRCIQPRQLDPAQNESRYMRDITNINFVREISANEYDKQAARHKGTQPNYGYLRLAEKFYVCGNTALPYMTDIRERRMLRSKYRREYYGLQFVSNMVQLYDGQPPDHLHVVAGHPPLTDNLKDDIEAALRGKWVVESMGQKIRFTVGTVFTEDEITAAVINLRYRVDGYRNGKQNNLLGKTTLVVDIGGGTVDVVRLDREGLPIDGTFRSSEIGIFQTILDFKDLFDAKYKHLLKDSSRGIALEQIYAIYLDKDKKLRSGGLPDGELPCRDIYEQATHGTMNSLYVLINEMTGNLLMDEQALIVGGAGDLWFDDLAESIFDVFADNGALFLGTHERGKGIFSASRGMAKLGYALRNEELRELSNGRSNHTRSQKEKA